MLRIVVKENTIHKQVLVFRIKETANKVEDLIVSVNNDDSVHTKVV